MAFECLNNRMETRREYIDNKFSVSGDWLGKRPIARRRVEVFHHGGVHRRYRKPPITI